MCFPSNDMFVNNNNNNNKLLVSCYFVLEINQPLGKLTYFLAVISKILQTHLENACEIT